MCTMKSWGMGGTLEGALAPCFLIMSFYLLGVTKLLPPPPPPQSENCIIENADSYLTTGNTLISNYFSPPSIFVKGLLNFSKRRDTCQHNSGGNLWDLAEFHIALLPSFSNIHFPHYVNGKVTYCVFLKLEEVKDHYFLLSSVLFLPLNKIRM